MSLNWDIRRKPVFVSEAQQKNAIAILKKTTYMCDVFHARKLHSDFETFFFNNTTLIVVADYLPACGLIDTHKNNENLVEYSENTKLYIIYGS